MENITASSDPFVLQLLKLSDVVWFAGGDQSVYVSTVSLFIDSLDVAYPIFLWLDLWYNSPIQSLLAAKAQIPGKPFTIGGTSAGMALLGYYIYTGANGSAVSAEALQVWLDAFL